MSEIEQVGDSSGFEWPQSQAVREPISKDEIFDVLSNHRRRYAFHYLKQHDGQLSLSDLAERVAAWESGVSLEKLPSKDRKRVYTSFQQFHLPKMQRLGLIQYDSQKKLITLAPEAEELDVYLDVTWENDITWSRYYAALSAIIGVCGIALWFNLYPFVLLPASGWMIATSVLLLVSALLHIHYDRESQFGTSGPPP